MAMLLIKNGLIHNAVDRNPFIADILVDNKKIVKIEPDISGMVLKYTMRPDLRFIQAL